ncbi:helix-turn-helix domain-containing protein [Bacillus salitolerans]|uniref:Helix-turn-helix domain-containing protein n=1 Tax=Bacillus salitolerans TaxID=1437434 RepID=A0ABW4LL21_9BACI
MAELGQRLKQAREDKNLTLEELQAITKIQKRYLQNIEENNYSSLPGVFYARAFVKQYAEAVGLNPEIIFEEFKDEIPSTQSDAIPEQLSRVKRTRAEVNSSDNRVFQILPKVLVSVVIIGVAIAVWTLLQNQNSPEELRNNNESENGAEFEEGTENPLKTSQPSDNKTNEEDETSASEEEQAEEQVSEPTQHVQLVESSGRNSIYTLTGSTEFLVEVETTGETWLDLKNGKNRKFFSGMLTHKAEDEIPDRTSYDYSNETEARIKVGKAMDSVIKINGEVLAIPEEPKDVQEITIRFEKPLE